MLEVPLHGAGVASTRPVYNRVSIPFTDLLALEGRSLSKWRTAVSVGAVVAAVAGGWSFLGGGDSSEDKPKTDIDNAVLPWFSISVPFFR